MTDAVSELLCTRRVVVLYQDSEVFHQPTCKHVKEEWQGRRGRTAPSHRPCMSCEGVSHSFTCDAQAKARRRGEVSEIVESGASWSRFQLCHPKPSGS